MIRLEKFDKNSYAKLISWVDSQETLMQFSGPAFSFPLTNEQLDKSLNNPDRTAYKVMDINTDTMIGYAEIYLTARSAYLGRILIGDKELRGRGIGQKIVDGLLDLAFSNTRLSVAELNVFDWNVAGIKCYEKAGFIINRDKKVERKVNGQSWIALNMTLDKSKWEQGRQK